MQAVPAQVEPERPAAGVSDRQRVRFTCDEVPRLLALFGVVAALHIAGFGLFQYYDSQPKFHSLNDGHGKLIFAGAAALAYGF